MALPSRSSPAAPFGALLTAAIVGLSAVPGFAQDVPERRIIVVGTAEVSAVPDVARLTLGVETRAESAGVALAENATAMRALFAALDGLGVAPQDRQTVRLDLAPFYRDRSGDLETPSEIAGYRADNLVVVVLRDIGALGGAVDAVAASGANRIDGIGFEMAEPDALIDAARAEAVRDGRARAELYAETAGVALGPVISITERGAAMPGPMMMRSEAAMDMPIAEGRLSLGASVEMVFGIE